MNRSIISLIKYIVDGNEELKRSFLLQLNSRIEELRVLDISKYHWFEQKLVNDTLILNLAIRSEILKDMVVYH